MRRGVRESQAGRPDLDAIGNGGEGDALTPMYKECRRQGVGG